MKRREELSRYCRCRSHSLVLGFRDVVTRSRHFDYYSVVFTIDVFKLKTLGETFAVFFGRAWFGTGLFFWMGPILGLRHVLDLAPFWGTFHYWECYI